MVSLNIYKTQLNRVWDYYMKCVSTLILKTYKRGIKIPFALIVLNIFSQDIYFFSRTKLLQDVETIKLQTIEITLHQHVTAT